MPDKEQTEITELRKAARALQDSRATVVLSGAGLSAESGIPTFRSPGGLWRNFRPEQLATPGAFANDPVTVWEWYDWRRQVIAAASPNKGHRTLARWEDVLENFCHITQNVDDLSERAGGSSIIKIHGSIFHTLCLRENTIQENRAIPLQEIPPRCRKCGAPLRPAVVWFGESLDEKIIHECRQRLLTAELLIIVGTSGIVFPAAQFATIARSANARIVEINTDRTPSSESAEIFLQGTAGEILGAIDELL